MSERHRVADAWPYQFNPFFGNQSQTVDRPDRLWIIGRGRAHSRERINLALLTAGRRRMDGRTGRSSPDQFSPFRPSSAAKGPVPCRLTRLAWPVHLFRAGRRP